jgi:cytoplasmic iron level regulating protein YaaA (DUF328/UPF0246 family)
MLIVLSPAKTLDESPVSSPLALTQPALLGDAEKLVRTARRLSVKKLRALMNISEKIAKLNQGRFRSFETPLTPDNALTAGYMFRGDTYRGLDIDTLDDDALAFAQDHLAILSGLYGILRPLDLVMPYRLEMGSALKTRRGSNLYAFWGARISEQIRVMTAEHETPVLINLASQEYFRAVKVPKLKMRVVTPVFRENRAGKEITVSFTAKRSRGMMARWIVQNRLTTPDRLPEFDLLGYQFQPDRSTEDTLLFIRPGP